MLTERQAWALLRKESIDAMQLHGEPKDRASEAAYAKYLETKEKGFANESSSSNNLVLSRNGKFMWYAPWKTE
jgi:hypothetical protein